MAVTKTHPIKSTLKKAVEYICNPDKTDGKLLVSSFGCSPETADIEFSWTRKQAIDKGENLGRHLIQAFEPGEVSPEGAHEIGMRLADEILGRKYEFVLTTHIDKGHIHNHLIFNAVSFVDHRCYHSNKRSYHYIRRVSDRLCKEHGLSVIVPGREKGKSYVEHAAERAGTSYKAKLKAAIDRLIPVSADFDGLLRRLEEEGWEIKRGKYAACKLPEQQRFTWLKNIGVDYTQEAITSRIAGGIRPSRQPKSSPQKISLLIDIQNHIKAQQNGGYAHWAKIHNLKEAARTLNFLSEHGITNYAELEERTEEISARCDKALSEVKQTEQRMSELSLLMKDATTYWKLKPLYDQYRKSKDKEKFLRGHEGEIILFEAAAREIKRRGIRRLPSFQIMKSEYDVLAEKKKALSKAHQEDQKTSREYDVIRQNVDRILRSGQDREAVRAPER